MADSVHHAHPSRTYETELSDRQLFAWGALGGFFFVAVTAGLFDLQRIQTMLESSQQPVVQFVSLTVFSIIVLIAGAAWARVHKPLRSGLVALQLGVIAPLAINALIAGFAPNTATPRPAPTPLSTPLGEERTRGITIPSILGDGPTAGPSVVKCIIKSVVKQAC